MPLVRTNGIDISFDEYGAGEAVVLVTGSGARGRMWTPHQVPALTAAGFRVITIDNRGVPPSATCPEGFALADMVADTAGFALEAGTADGPGQAPRGPRILSFASHIITGALDAMRYDWDSAQGSYERLLGEGVTRPGDYGVLMTMGPGSTIETALVRW